MTTKEITLYNFTELSDEAKSKARQLWIGDGALIASWLGDDFEPTLDEFCKICDIKAKDWEVDDWHHSFSIDYGCYAPYERMIDEDTWEDVYIEDLSGKLLFRYVCNNIIPYLMKGKYHSTSGYTDEDGKYHYKSRRSRVVIDLEPEKGGCPLTGMCHDCDIIEPLMKYYRNWAKYPADYTYADLMEECLESFFSAWQKEWEWRLSDETVDEDIESNWDEDMFLEDGRMWRA